RHGAGPAPAPRDLPQPDLTRPGRTTMRTVSAATILALAAGLALPPGPRAGEPAKPAGKTIALHLRSRTETAKGSGRYHALTREVKWDAAKTAVVICDMWDKHWCPGATARVAEMAPRMNRVVAEARRRGALV